MLESLNQFKFLIVFLNLVVLYLVLRRLLFKPVTQFMENRTKMIKDSIDNAEKVKIEALDLKHEYEEQLKTAKAKGDKIIADTRAKAEKDYDGMIVQAKKESETILTQAREEIEREREQMLKDIRSQVASIALAAASKVIEANMDTESNRVLVGKFIDEAGAA
jgi:F-type H+-transporting ATPase subunit b